MDITYIFVSLISLLVGGLLGVIVMVLASKLPAEPIKSDKEG